MANSRQSATIFSPSSKRPTKRTRSSITEHSFQGITPSPKGKKCHPCVRYKVSPMSQAAQKRGGTMMSAFSVGNKNCRIFSCRLLRFNDASHRGHRDESNDDDRFIHKFHVIEIYTSCYRV